MGKPELSSVIMNSTGKQGMLGKGGDNSAANPKLDNRLTGKNATGNRGELNADRAKPSSLNPGKDMGFWAKGGRQMDTTGHGKLGVSCKLS